MKKIMPFLIFILCSCGYKSLTTEQSLNDYSHWGGIKPSHLMISKNLNEMSIAFQLNAREFLNYNYNYNDLSERPNYHVDYEKSSQHDFKFDTSMDVDSLLKYQYSNYILINGNIIFSSYNHQGSDKQMEGEPDKKDGSNEKADPKSRLETIIEVLNENSIKSIFSLLFLIISTVWGMLLLSSSESKVKAERALSLLNKASLTLDSIKGKSNVLVNPGDIEEFLHYLESANQALSNVTLQEHVLSVKHYSQLIVVNLVPWDVHSELENRKLLNLAFNNPHTSTVTRGDLEEKYEVLKDKFVKSPVDEKRFSYLIATTVLLILFIYTAFVFLNFIFLG